VSSYRATPKKFYSSNELTAPRGVIFRTLKIKCRFKLVSSQMTAVVSALKIFNQSPLVAIDAFVDGI
jgi:hypothetical protein